MQCEQGCFTHWQQVATSMHGVSSLITAILMRSDEVLCRTVAVSCACMHACAADGSFLQRFLDTTQKMSPAERGAYLEHPPPGAPDLDDAHHVRVLSYLSATGSKRVMMLCFPAHTATRHSEALFPTDIRGAWRPA